MSIFRDGQARRYYEHMLPTRYSISGRQITWDVEENPPIPDSPNAEESACEEKESSTGRPSKISRQESPTAEDTSSPTNNSKYRCKLCGQPKHNHNCPYRPSLQRSIGVMVYPAANAHAAAEPGRIAPALTEMNSAVLSENNAQEWSGMMVTPEAVRGPAAAFHSPGSTLSDDSIPKRLEETSTPFVTSVTLHPEHFRAITPSANTNAYSYPPIPLTFTERKLLSDSLFFLAKQIPHMSQETAAVLRQARLSDEWDQGMAELLTQVVIGLYCAEGDARLDGLQIYLLSLGISC